MKPHKWAKEIKAWADGAEIEWRFNSVATMGEWESVLSESPRWDDPRCEYRIKPQTSAKCIVKDCMNHTHEGKFVGELCAPCWDYITNGKGVHSQAYRNAQPKEPQYLYVYQSNSNDYIFDIGLTEHPRINPNLWTKIGKIKLEVDDD